jgi:hypothetical protein
VDRIYNPTEHAWLITANEVTIVSQTSYGGNQEGYRGGGWRLLRNDFGLYGTPALTR